MDGASFVYGFMAGYITGGLVAFATVWIISHYRATMFNHNHYE